MIDQDFWGVIIGGAVLGFYIGVLFEREWWAPRHPRQRPEVLQRRGFD